MSSAVASPAPAHRVRAPRAGPRAAAGATPIVAHRAALREQQVAVAELVPQVTARVRCGVGPFERRPAGDRLEHQQVRRLGLVPAGEQPVDRAHAALGRDDELGPARRRVHDAALVGRRSRARAPRWCRPRRRAARGVHRVDVRGRGAGHAVALGVRHLVRFERRHAGVQQDRRDRDAARDEVDDELGGERPAALGISALPGSVPKICWYAVERPGAGHVPVADRLAVPGEVVEHRRREMRRREPQPPRVGEAVEQVQTCRRRRASTSTPVRSSANGAVVSPTGRAGFDEPEAAGQLGGEVDAHRAARRQRAPSIAAGIVADVFTTSASPAREVRGEIGERRVRRRRASPCETSSRTSPRPRRGFGRLVRFERGIEAGSRAPSAGRSQHGGHDTTSASAQPARSGDAASIRRRARARPLRAAAGRRCLRRGTRPGASRCACRRDRPTQHAQLGLLGGEHRRQVLERGLRRAVAAPALVGLDRGVGRDVHDRARATRPARAAAPA